MKRSTLWILLSFAAGMAVSYGLVLLDRQASVPRVGPTDIFEVVLPDGTVHHLSYAEIDRERQELFSLRQRLMEIQKKPSAAPPPAAGLAPAESVESGLPAERPEALAQGPKQAEPEPAKDPQKNLSKFIAKIFSQPIMKDLLTHQTDRQAGELAAVLDLNPEQRAKLDEILKNRKSAFPWSLEPGTPGPAAEEERRASDKTLEEEIQPILSPAQVQRYHEYTDGKNALSRAPQVDRDLFEVSWRLKLTEEQEKLTRQIFQEQFQKGRTLSPLSSMEPEAPTSERIESYLQKKSSLDRETGERMKKVLDEGQHEAFLEYQREKDAESQLLRRLLDEEKAAETPRASPQE